jgi:hypothetical protein
MVWVWLLWAAGLATWVGLVYRYFLAPVLAERKLLGQRDLLLAVLRARGRPVVRSVVLVVNEASGDNASVSFVQLVLVPVLRAAQVSMSIVRTQPDSIDMPTDWMKTDAVAIVGGDGAIFIIYLPQMEFINILNH